MQEVTTRATTRKATLGPDAPRVMITHMCGEGRFRPARITETLTETVSTSAVYTRRVRYDVEVSGPVVLMSGRDHATRNGRRTYSDDREWHGTATPMSALPDELRRYLDGPDSLEKPL